MTSTSEVQYSSECHLDDFSKGLLYIWKLSRIVEKLMSEKYRWAFEIKRTEPPLCHKDTNGHNSVSRWKIAKSASFAPCQSGAHAPKFRTLCYSPSLPLPLDLSLSLWAASGSKYRRIYSKPCDANDFSLFRWNNSLGRCLLCWMPMWNKNKIILWRTGWIGELFGVRTENSRAAYENQPRKIIL